MESKNPPPHPPIFQYHNCKHNNFCKILKFINILTSQKALFLLYWFVLHGVEIHLKY